MNQVLALYQKLSAYPLGKLVFRMGVSLRAPYFGTITPTVADLRPGYCRVTMKDRRAVRNHIGSVHAGALCTISELSGGLAVDASIPANLRWIPRKMTVLYLKKAKGTLTATCELDPGTLMPGDIEVTVAIENPASELVCRATIFFYISEKPR